MIAPSSSLATATTFVSTGENMIEHSAPVLSAVCADTKPKFNRKKYNKPMINELRFTSASYQAIADDPS